MVESSSMSMLRPVVRVILYPSWKEVVDYFKWRQVDSKKLRLHIVPAHNFASSTYQQSIQYNILGLGTARKHDNY